MKRFFIIAAIFIGILFTLQIRSFKKIEFLVQRSGSTGVLQELRVFQVANTHLRENIEKNKTRLLEIQNQIASQSVEDEIARLRLFAGEDLVVGGGIKITLSGSVKEFWVEDLVAQLVSAGAEALAVNDIRITPKTMGFREIRESGGMLVRRYFVKAPLVISAIGNSQELKSSVAQNGGILDRIKGQYPQLKIEVVSVAKIEMPALPE